MTAEPFDERLLSLITPQFLAENDRPGPRYTSYPTAVEFHEGFTSAEYRQALATADQRADKPLSLYVHIPFCAQRCTFCGCNVIVSKRPEVVERYLQSLFAEIELLAAALPHRRHVVQHHWGGGTPTHLTIDQMTRLMGHLREHFHIDNSREVAIEVDPDVTTDAQIKALAKLGFNRMSLGVQDFDERVLAAAGRPQKREDIYRVVRTAREEGFQSINFDLIYGLPYQDVASFSRTIDEVIRLRPDRIAVYSFAYVPWMKKNQQKLDTSILPDRDTKFALFATAITGFLRAGYLQIGMDHFALKDDEMGKAVGEGTLYRNFMGYTVHRAPDMLGLGVSSIGAVGGAFSQNVKGTAPYHAALASGEFPVERGYVLSDDDLVRQAVITELMCNFHVRFASIEARFPVSFQTYFAGELETLQNDASRSSHPFTRITADGIEVTAIGRLFVRNVCTVFDRYLQLKNPDKPVFSRTV